MKKFQVFVNGRPTGYISGTDMGLEQATDLAHTMYWYRGAVRVREVTGGDAE